MQRHIGTEQGSQGLLWDSRPGGVTHSRAAVWGWGPQGQVGLGGRLSHPRATCPGQCCLVHKRLMGAGLAYSSLGTGWTVPQTVSLGTLCAAPLSLFPPTQPSRLGQRMRFWSRGAVLAPGLHKGSPASFPPTKPSLGACVDKLCAQGGPACPSLPLSLTSASSALLLLLQTPRCPGSDCLAAAGTPQCMYECVHTCEHACIRGLMCECVHAVCVCGNTHVHAWPCV